MFEEGQGTSCLYDFYEQGLPSQLDKFQLIAVTDAASCPHSLVEQVARIANCQHKPAKLILRAKELDDDAYGELATKIQSLCLEHGIEIILHTHWQLARDLRLTAVHVPLPLLASIPLQVRKSLHISTSVHSVAEAEQALQLGAKALIAGHIYATSCKPDLPPRGLNFLRNVYDIVVKHTTPMNQHPSTSSDISDHAPIITDTIIHEFIPLYAIGGIGFDVQQWRELQSSGATGACIMSGYMQI
ncbi:MAG: thiamine phosphate synthase [Phascolarctobacterium sp.]